MALSVIKNENFEKKMEEFQTTVFHKQVVSGHEPKGRTFYRKPSYVHFKVSGRSAQCLTLPTRDNLGRQLSTTQPLARSALPQVR